MTTDLSIATDYLVYRHGRSKPGISVKIKQKQERSRLNELMDSIISSSELPESLRGNFIVRSAADGISANELTADINCFIDIWQSIEVLKLQKSPIVVYQESHRFHRLINAMFAQGINRLTVDCAEFLKQINQWCDLESHEPKIHAELFAAKGNVFDSYQIEEQINAALDVEVALDCGGYLVIEQTEALSVIDVNTGSFIGDSADKNTFYKVNIEAAIESAKQIRLRNLSGIIIIDFIDMQNVDHRRKVLKELKNAFLDDPISNKISDFTEFGLVQIARKRTSRSLSQILCAPFKHSEARGVKKSEETLCLEIIRELIKIESNCAWKSIEICTSSAIIEILNNKYSTQLNDFKSSTHCDVKLSPDRAMKSNQYNIIPTR